MVNNQSKEGAYLFRSFLAFLFFSSFSLMTNAQNISKYYELSIQENGALYFIQPKYEFKAKRKRCKLSCDLTFLTSNDSVSLNFSFFDTNIITIDSISFVQENNKQIASKTRKIYVEPVKKLWLHRYSARFLFDDIKSMFNQEKKITVLIYHDQSSSIQLYTKKGKWEKQSTIMSKIFALINANKKQIDCP